jgi:hypothetical protein
MPSRTRDLSMHPGDDVRSHDDDASAAAEEEEEEEEEEAVEATSGKWEERAMANATPTTMGRGRGQWRA